MRFPTVVPALVPRPGRLSSDQVIASRHAQYRLHTRVTARHHLASQDYRLGQLRYDLSKLRAKGLVERMGKTRRYCLTPLGLKLGVLLVRLRMRLLGPLASLIRQPNTNSPSRHLNSVDAAYHEVDTALDHLSAALGLQHAA